MKHSDQWFRQRLILKQPISLASRVCILLIFFSLSLLSQAPAAGQEASNWSEPVNLSNSETHSNTPSIAVDPAGDVHVIWSEETDDGRSFIAYARLMDGRWSPANEIIASPHMEEADYPSMVADSRGYLHLVWRGDATLYYSQAYAPEASSAQSWSKPQALEFVQNNIGELQLVIDAQDKLHLIYAINIGANSGIYYNWSINHGQTWSDPVLVYQNTRSERMVDFPRLAVSQGGALHAIWVEHDHPETFPPLGIRYASSNDGGKTWSDPISLIDGAYHEPGIIVRDKQEVHIAWSGTGADRYKFYRWSPDSGRTWSKIYRNNEVGGFQGFPALVVDSSQRLHWLMVGTVYNIGKDALYHTVLKDDIWLPGDTLLSNTSVRNNPRDVAAVITDGNELHVVWSNSFDTDSLPEGWQSEIYYLHTSLDSPHLISEKIFQPKPVAATDQVEVLPTPNTQNIPTLLFDRSPASRAKIRSPIIPITVGTLAAAMMISVVLFAISLRKRHP